MQAKGFLHKLLSSVMHKKRLSTLSHMVVAGLKSKKLSLTSLGRAMVLPTQERSCIRRSDRFLGNKHLEKERIFIYEAVINRLVVNQNPDIIVDWSKMPNNTFHVLRASLVTKGRAITLYEELHSESKLGNEKVQNNFLDQLKKLLPKACVANIITDAGFHTEWFKKITDLKWHYIGRIRADSRRCYRADENKPWEKLLPLYKTATNKPTYLGQMYLYKSKSIKTHFYLYKEKPKGRKLLNKSGAERSSSKANKYKKSSRDPWLLVSSLSGRGMDKVVVNKYFQRMQIEESFRDLKSSQYGLGFEHAYSRKKERIQLLLMVGMLIVFIAWLTGLAAEKNKLQFQFQSNSTKDRRVLSLFYLGLQVIRKKIKIPNRLLWVALEENSVWDF